MASLFVATLKELKNWVMHLLLIVLSIALKIATDLWWKGLFLKYLSILKAANRFVLDKDYPTFSRVFWHSNFLVVWNYKFLVAVRQVRQIIVFTLLLWVSAIILFAVYCSSKGLNPDLNLSKTWLLMNWTYFFLMRDIWITFFCAIFLNKLNLSVLEKYPLSFFL